jgi:hypothetical protein
MRTGIFILVFTLGAILADAQSPPVYRIASDFEGINAEQERYNDLYKYTQVMEDPTGEWTYEDVLAKTDAFEPNTTRSQKDLQKVFWVMLQLQAPKKDSFLFSVGKLYDDHNLVDVYYLSADSLVHQRSGYMLQPAEKVIRRSGSYFWIHLPADTLRTIYFRVDNLYRDCSCYNKNPVSVFHIDRQSAKYGQGVYVLRDFASVPAKDKGPRKVDLVRYFEFYPDPDCNLKLEDVQRDWDQKSYFRGYKRRDMPFDTCHWVRLQVVNPKPESQTRTFAYDWSRWAQINYYLPDQEGHYQRFEAFPDAGDQEAFSFTIAPLDTLVLYIRYPARGNTLAFNGEMLDIHSDDLKERQERVVYKYLFVGMFLFFLVYFFLQLIVNPDKLLLYYFLSIVGMSPFIVFSLDHTAFFTHTRSVFLPISPISFEYAMIVGRLIAIYGLLKFIQTALDLKRLLPWYYHLSNWIILLMQVLTVANLIVWTMDWNGRLQVPLCLSCILFDITAKFGGLAAGFMLFTGIRAYLKKVPLSGTFLLALTPLALAIFWNSFLYQFLFPDVEIFGPFLVGLFLTLLLFGVMIGAHANRINLEKTASEKQKILLENELLQIEFKALRAQMNPHFIFNCLNSIKSLIQQSANKQAIHYLTQFSKFIRNVLQHSEEKRITLEEELDMSRLYLEMEKLRFERSFNYKITVAPEVDTSFIKVPPLILQPFLENAIWHGLMHKNGERMLNLEISREGETVKCMVDDNGIGRQKAAVLQAGTRSQHRSFGTRLIADRLKLNKELFDSNYMINIIDKMVNGQAAGTRVELSLSI